MQRSLVSRSSDGVLPCLGIVLLSALAGLTPTAGHGRAAEEAQQAVYPTYQGWIANPDGTHTLVFGYYNHNPVPVVVPVGPENSFTPGPADRGQPTVFLPGRRRSTCRMVVPADFTGNLQWTLGSGGTATTTTTEKGGLDPLYLIESIGHGYRATRDVDTAAVPRGVCLNRAPEVFAGRDLSAVVGVPTTLAGRVADDALPRDSVLSARWSKLSGPGEVIFDHPEGASSEATFREAGVYELQLAGSDGELESTDSVTVTVEPAAVPR